MDSKHVYAIYSRKSRFTGKGDSIENQIGLCKQYILSHFDAAAENCLIYEDEGFSGGNLERPQFQMMMQDARAHRFQAVICYRLDRISRNIGDFAKLIEELNTLHVSFISIKEQFDTASPMGRAMMYIASVFSQLERETIAERIRDNMQELAKTGRWLGGVTPTGYASKAVQKITLDGKSRKMFQLTVIPSEAALVKLIFSKFIETGSLTQTETFFIQQGFQTKNKKTFTRFALKNILSNPVYLIAEPEAYAYFTSRHVELFAAPAQFDGIHGILAYNKTLQKPGKANHLRAMSEWIIAVGRHEGLISSHDWIYVQQRLDRNRSKAYRRPRSHTALLSGRLFCGNCGGYMRPKLGQRQEENGGRSYSYLCQTKEKSRCQCCNMPNVNGNLLDAQVCAKIGQLPFDPSTLLKQVANSNIELDEEGKRSELTLARLQKSIAENEKQIAALVSALADTSALAATNYITSKIEQLHQVNQTYKQNIDVIWTQQHASGFSDTQMQEARKAIAAFSSLLHHITVEQKRAVLHSIIQKAMWDGNTLHLYLSAGEQPGL